jgi:hypothetical protein
VIYFDLEGEIRIAFAPPIPRSERMRDVAPEVIDRWPRADERALVYLAGRLLAGRLTRDRRIKVPPLASIISRCTDDDPAGRFDSLRELREALAPVATNVDAERRKTSPAAWEQIEEGIGLLALNEPDLALARFDAALQIDSSAFAAARAGRVKAYAMGAQPDDPYTRMKAVAACGHGRFTRPRCSPTRIARGRVTCAAISANRRTRRARSSTSPSPKSTTRCWSRRTA